MNQNCIGCPHAIKDGMCKVCKYNFSEYNIQSPWKITKERYDELNRSPFNAPFNLNPVIGPGDTFDNFEGYEISFSDRTTLTEKVIDDFFERIAEEMLKGYKDD